VIFHGVRDMARNVKINITISEELDQRFRKTVADTLGFKKGNLQMAIEEAIRDWIKKQTQQKVE